MTLIDGDRIITAQLYDDEHEEFTEKKMSIIDYINAYTDEGVTEADVVDCIKESPSVEPERKSGKWIEGKKTPGYIKWNCSECSLLVRNPQKPWYEYCPKCGAKMGE